MGTRGASSAHLAYLSRATAVMERDGSVRGVATQNLPREVLEASSYAELRDNLIAYAAVREDEEGRGRTHYRALMSFEVEVSTDRAKQAAAEWLRTAFPEARGLAFVHRNTAHTHVHLWIDARLVTGKKIDLPPRVYHRLDETWNRIYCRETGRDEREHLEKKDPGHRGDELRGEKDPDESRVGRDTCASRGASRPGETAARGAGGRKPEAQRGAFERHRLFASERRAIQEADRLRETALRVARRENEIEKDRGDGGRERP